MLPFQAIFAVQHFFHVFYKAISFLKVLLLNAFLVVHRRARIEDFGHPTPLLHSWGYDPYGLRILLILSLDLTLNHLLFISLLLCLPLLAQLSAQPFVIRFLYALAFGFFLFFAFLLEIFIICIHAFLHPLQLFLFFLKLLPCHVLDILIFLFSLVFLPLKFSLVLGFYVIYRIVSSLWLLHEFDFHPLFFLLVCQQFSRILFILVLKLLYFEYFIRVHFNFSAGSREKAFLLRCLYPFLLW